MYSKFVSIVCVAGTAVVITPALVGAHAETVPPGDEPEICQPWVEASMIFSSDNPDPVAAEEAIVAVEAAVPDELAGDVPVVLDAARKALTGDFSGFESPEFTSSVSAADNFVYDNCAFDSQIEVQAVDWAFGDIPLEITAGLTAFRLNNLGDEIHELALVRKVEGTTESFAELAPLIAAEEPSVMDKVEFVSGAFSPGADVPGVAFAELEPGEYAAICFIPIGALQGAEMDMGEGEGSAGSMPPSSDSPATTGAGADTTTAGTTGASVDGDAPAGDAGYDAHFAHGMLQEFTVIAG